ncbi:MAG: 3-oxoacyl-ACP reductase FabG [Pseudomonadota bacterium]
MVDRVLEGEIALVSGASRGIGAAIARVLASQGATVIGTATSQGGADGIEAALREAGAKGHGLVLDVSNDDSVTEAFAAVKELAGPPTILVNNAGITRDNLLMRMKGREWDEVLNTNLTSMYRMCKAALRGMTKARKGRIINVASVVGLMGNAGQANYAAAKAGIIGFSKSLAREVGSREITVNVVAPGFIATDMTDALDEAQRDALQGQIALARLGSADDIAAAVAFLASPAAAYITGETLNVNGGLHMQ